MPKKYRTILIRLPFALQKGRELCRKLTKMPVRVVQHQQGRAPSELTIECESPILAHAQGGGLEASSMNFID